MRSTKYLFAAVMEGLENKLPIFFNVKLSYALRREFSEHAV